MSGTTLFQPYMQMPGRLSPLQWRMLRWCGVVCAAGLIVLAIADPALGLRLFWGLYVPILPLLFLVAPGLWRNVCPMASLNQIPRTLGFTRGLTLPPTIQQYTPLVSAGLFLLIVPLRKVVLDHSGLALAVFLATVLGLAFVGGVVFKGKSGWCSQFCPMLQVERFYGQSPLLVVSNSHCRPCVGCNKNCYDFNPTAAYLADLHDDNPRLAQNRKLFAGALPWVIAAFFSQPYVTHPTVSAVLAVYGHILLFAAAGMGVFLVLELVTQLSAQKIVLAHVVAAINVFYYFVAPLALSQYGLTTGPWSLLIEVAVVALSLLWLRQAWPRERAYLSSGSAVPARAANAVLKVSSTLRTEKAAVAFEPGPTVLTKIGETLLDVAEANGVGLASGCRMGMCGADPVRIVAGGDNLSAPTAAERATLDLLGLDVGCRMACCARIQGAVTVSLSTAADGAIAAPAEADARPVIAAVPGVERIVVIGAGVAGVTTAVEARKLQAGAHITLIGAEPYDFYNRMAIDRLVGEETGIAQLYLMPRDWAETRGIRYLRGVSVRAIARDVRRVTTEDGEDIPYDRLVLATGARSAVPPLDGFGMSGTFVLRTIDDAIRIQQDIRGRRTRTAVIIGGGPLGLEAARSISGLGVRVMVLDRGPWPLSRQLDEPAGSLLRQLMGDLGIEIVSSAEAARVVGGPWVRGVELKDGRALPADLCLVAAGIEPEVGLAREAGLEVRRGIVVDEHMMSSDPAIYAVGDVAEHEGRIVGLWPAGVAQARVATANLLGGDGSYVSVIPPMKLKVAGIDLLSVGEVTARSDDAREVRLAGGEGRHYRKLVLDGGRLVGAILIGHADLTDVVSSAVDERRQVGHLLEELERGDWSVLANEPAILSGT